MQLKSVGDIKVREKVEELAHVCDITPKNRQGFVEEILTVITKYKMRDYKAQLAGKK